MTLKLCDLKHQKLKSYNSLIKAVALFQSRYIENEYKRAHYYDKINLEMERIS